MERRSFLGKISAGFLMLLATSSTALLTGCALTPANVQALINVLINSINSILKVATGAPWAVQLAAALTALQTAEQQWASGGTITIIDDALNTVMAVLAVIPLTAVYSPLIDLVVSGVEAVLAVLPVSPAITKLRGALSANPHHGRVVLHKTSLLHETPSGAYKAQWNSICGQIGLPQARL